MENEQRACRKPRWYDCSFRSPIDPSTLRRLMRRSNLQGALQALGPSRPVRRYRHPHGLVLTQALWLPFSLALWCHGTFATFMYIAGHDLGHGTVFRTRWLNRFFRRHRSTGIGWPAVPQWQKCSVSAALEGTQLPTSCISRFFKPPRKTTSASPWRTSCRP